MLLFLSVSLAKASVYRVIDDHIQADLGLLEAKEDVKIVEQDFATTKGQFLPRIDAYVEYESNDDGASQVVADDTTDKQTGLEMSWNVFNSFSDVENLDSTRFELKSSNNLKVFTQYTAEERVFNLVTLYKLQYETISIYRKKLESLFRLKNLVNKKIKERKMRRVNLTRLEIEIVNTHNLLNQFKAKMMETEARVVAQTSVKKISDIKWPYYQEIKNLKYEKLEKLKTDIKKYPFFKFVTNNEEAKRKKLISEQLRQLGGINVDLRRGNSFLDGRSRWQTELAVKWTVPLYARNEFQSDIQRAVKDKYIAKKRKIITENLLREKVSQVDFRLKIAVKNFRDQIDIVKKSESLENSHFKEIVNNRTLQSARIIEDLDRIVQTKVFFYNSQKELILAMLEKCHLNGFSYKNCLK
jgi:hypothetical protein